MVESIVHDYVSERLEASPKEIRSSMERVFYKKTGVSSPLDGVVATFLKENGISHLHCPATGSRIVLKREFAEQFVNVAFVRDPFKRFVSGFMEKHIEGSFTHVFRPSSFVDGARNIGRLEWHHFCPQTSCAYLPRLTYDRVFDIERIDYGYLSDVLGMEVEPRVMHRQWNYSGDCPAGLSRRTYEELASMKKSGDMPRHECFYDEESRSLVEKHYERDFEFMRRWLKPESS